VPPYEDAIVACGVLPIAWCIVWIKDGEKIERRRELGLCLR
jgi:hypothetical protein